MIRYRILASGSSGNLTLIETEKAKVLVDCGVSGRKAIQKLEEVGVAVEEIDAILLTHSHTDHVQGIPRMSRYIPIYLTEKLYEKMEDKVSDKHEPRFFKANEVFWINDIKIMPVSVSHDCVDPVCFAFRCGAFKMGVVTDLGIVNKRLISVLKGSHAMIMEANHDEALLKQSDRHPKLISRILSDVGHLSNRAAGRFLAQIHTEDLKEVVLVHLSQDCNTNELAVKTIQEELTRSDIFFDQFEVAGPGGVQRHYEMANINLL